LSNNLALVYHHFGYPILYQISDWCLHGIF
jgi:hypothetical protein